MGLRAAVVHRFGRDHALGFATSSWAPPYDSRRACATLGGVAAQPVLHVFTFRRGLLAVLGHDLRLHVGRFELEVNGTALEGRFETGSLRVDGAVKRGALDPDALSASDRAKIERAIAEEVLLAQRFPQATLEAEVRALGGLRFTVRGKLTLRERAQDIACAVEPLADRLVSELDLVPSQFGIPPYHALGGSLVLEDRVRIVLSVPPADAAAHARAGAELHARWTLG